MRHVTLIIASLSVVLVPGQVFAGDLHPASAGEAYANRNCSWCHGGEGRGFATAPRLAGQTRLYIEAQLQSFASHSRDNPKSQQFMWGAAERVDPATAAEVALYYSALPSSPANDGNEALIEGGHTSYRDGRIEANIPSCVACHGPNAEGVGAIPRLAGLSYRYLKRRLVQWGQGYHLAAKAPMAEVAKNLPPADIEALASYLSFAK